jgi:hypothetical protein
MHRICSIHVRQDPRGREKERPLRRRPLQLPLQRHPRPPLPRRAEEEAKFLLTMRAKRLKMKVTHSASKTTTQR